MPEVCICVPTYNAERTIGETISSILAQDYPNLVIRVVDNASTDRTRQIVEQFNDPRLILYRNDRNIGAEGNFTRCIQLASGKYAAIFHADDLYEPHMVRSQVEFLEDHGDVGVVFTEALVIDEGGHAVGEMRMPRPLRAASDRLDFAQLFKRILEYSNFLICPSALVRTDVYRNSIREWRCGLFGSSADLDVWFRIARICSVAVLCEPLTRYRVSAAQGSTELIKLRTERADFFRVIDHYIKRADVRDMLTKEDFRNYERLKRSDCAVRAMNLFTLGNVSEARRIAREALAGDSLLWGLSRKRGLQTVLLAGFIWLAAALPWQSPAAGILRRVRQRLRR